jgi:2'-5' RNA ligase
VKRAPSSPGGAAKVRAFLALEIEPEARARLAGLVAELEGRMEGVRWVGSHAVHLTLRFLGSASRGQLDRLTERLRPAAAACPPFETRMAGLGLFPERGRPRVLWIDVPLPSSALALQGACEEAAVAVGFARETRPFRSHLTLGRWRDGGARPSLPEADLGPLRLRTLVLFRSDLRPSGAVYAPLATFPLGEP